VTPATLSSFNIDSTFTVLAANTLNYSMNGNAGTLREEVIKVNSTGQLDFLYQLTNTGGPGFTQASAQSFAGVTTDVSQTSTVTGKGVSFNTGKDSVTTATRDASPGSTLTFTYGSNLTSQSPGFIQIIATNATTFNSNGSWTLGSGSTTTTISGTFEPVAVPEPASLALWGGLFGGLGAITLRKKLKRGLTTPQVG
jgi:hypothetical protein